LRSRLQSEGADLPLFFRPDYEKDAEQQRTISDALARSLEILRSTVVPDTFLGRRTQEPFPKEDDTQGRGDPFECWVR
jgi:hypothetical protein